MRIAIVDDDIRDAGKIEFALMDIAKDILIDKYESGSAFIEKIKGGVFYDIVFMDVYLILHLSIRPIYLMRYLMHAILLMVVLNSLV